VRRLYEAVAKGDATTAADCFAEDAVWHLPGRSLIAGDHRGRDAIGKTLATLKRLTNGTFKAALMDILVGNSHVVALQHATGERSGKKLDLLACQLITVRHGRIESMQGFYSDQYALDAFWS
jgi:uncharacterized protein